MTSPNSSSPLTKKVASESETLQIPAITVENDKNSTDKPHIQIPFPSKKETLQANRKVTVASKIPKGACPTKLDQLKKAFVSNKTNFNESSSSSLLSVQSIQSDDHLLQLPDIGNQDVESFLDEDEYEEMMKNTPVGHNGMRETWTEEVVEMHSPQKHEQ
mmetsp:Transcript_7411/g.27696  ORF Transcript_7411/g.27696 Transcript_7411/m.27696 type:complete len:160 (-) Transcript_7411:132-611(-)|eukprot:CAMPEP_0117446664 /NCGR_PEP_ID=MMETSP0759-20121206/6466_1 /TAXON_ID=63605 /ORGANISM="Percolomonas cosmopolitus, Strain WS" /LENGTH=159 /DNA_ID=CAMNT_0005238955 /DNA_START=199 /DNA_END=678 /DNA_ORIENTATION=+